MNQRRVNLTLAMPRCGYCGSFWAPPEGVNARNAFCPQCAEARRDIVRAHFQLMPITADDGMDGYLLPRSLGAG
jgi:hypothetical protein